MCKHHDMTASGIDKKQMRIFSYVLQKYTNPFKVTMLKLTTTVLKN